VRRRVFPQVVKTCPCQNLRESEFFHSPSKRFFADAIFPDAIIADSIIADGINEAASSISAEYRARIP